MTSSSADLSWLTVPPHPQPTDRTARKAKNISKADGSEIVLHEHLAAIDLPMLRIRLFATGTDISNRWRRRGRARQVEVVPRPALRVFNFSNFKCLAPNETAVTARELVLFQIAISNHRCHATGDESI
jgi:hypothetical protein